MVVGAYNTVFGKIDGRVGNDAFKLANIGFSVTETTGTPDTTEVSEPGLSATHGLLTLRHVAPQKTYLIKLDFRSLTGGTTCQFFLLTRPLKYPKFNNIFLAQIMLKKVFIVFVV